MAANMACVGMCMMAMEMVMVWDNSSTRSRETVENKSFIFNLTFTLHWIGTYHLSHLNINRLEAISKLNLALSQTICQGIPCNLEFLQAIVGSKDFIQGNTTTAFLDSFTFTPHVIQVIHPGLDEDICVFICLSMCLPDCLSMCLSICLSMS